jgi:hypothetical protein
MHKSEDLAKVFSEGVKKKPFGDPGNAVLKQ